MSTKSNLRIIGHILFLVGNKVVYCENCLSSCNILIICSSWGWAWLINDGLLFVKNFVNHEKILIDQM